MFDKIIGKAKQTADDFKERAEVVSDKVTDSVNTVLDELNAATPSLTKAGYELEEVEIEIGVVPTIKLRYRQLIQSENSALPDSEQE